MIMRRRAAAVLYSVCSVLSALAMSACAGQRAPQVDTSQLPTLSPAERMGRAAALVRAGCLDCLTAAYESYVAFRADSAVGGVDPAVGERATEAAVRAAALIALRERELGIADSGMLLEARTLVTSTTAFAASITPLLEIIETLGARGPAGTGPIASDAQLEAVAVASRNRETWTTLLRGRADQDELTAYLWVAFNCSYNSPRDGIGARDEIDALLSVVPAWKDTPLVRFRAASCAVLQIPALEALRNEDPRFVEVAYFSGLQSLILGELEPAEEQLAAANQWRPRWPAVTSLRAGAFMTAEEFERAADLYGQTLELVPDHVEAMLGRLRALVFLGRYSDAIAVSNRLLTLERWYIGDAYYWRAMAEQHLERYDDAWNSIEASAALLTNADVPKLAGIIAVMRRQPLVARVKFEEALGRNPLDCETPYFLGSILVEQQAWADSVNALMAASACFDGSHAALEGDIARIRASPAAPERQARQIARREQRIAMEARMRATARFNTAVALFNQARYAEARELAGLLANDEQFGDRVRSLLARMPSAAR